eukprot:2807237-Rhodomonas_salina.1
MRVLTRAYGATDSFVLMRVLRRAYGATRSFVLMRVLTRAYGATRDWRPPPFRKSSSPPRASLAQYRTPPCASTVQYSVRQQGYVISVHHIAWRDRNLHVQCAGTVISPNKPRGGLINFS